MIHADNEQRTSPRAQLDAYLDTLRRRLSSLIFARAAAAMGAVLLVLTCATVWWMTRSGFASYAATTGRVAIVGTLLVCVAFLLWWPLRRLRGRDGATEFERHLPAQHGRIETYLDIKRREAAGGTEPLADLLAADAVAISAATPIDVVLPRRNVVLGAGIALAALTALALLLTMGPAYWGYGSRYLLLGAELPRVAVPVRRIVVTPGNATVRRNSDFTIRASMEGFDPEQAAVYVRFDDEEAWQSAPMQALANKSDDNDERTWEFRLFAVRDSLQYYVTAQNARSTQHSVAVADLPRIERVRLTYSYPQWTALTAVTDDSARDISGVAGTRVQVEVFADAPLDSPVLVVDGKPAAMTGDSVDKKAGIGNIALKEPGRYHIGARVANEFVALTDDYRIEIVNDEKPTIEIVKPGRDWRATPIEEVPVHVQAQDDFRLQDLELRYAVNGGEWRTLELGANGKQADANSLLRLEELAAQGTPDAAAKTSSAPLLVPGDLVSYYAVAKDRSTQVETDLFMVQVQPFERRFTQNQGGGGGGGGGEQEADISERQREILLATWNLQRTEQRGGTPRSREQLKENAAMLSEMQLTLAEQARTVAERTRARIAVENDPSARSFVEGMELAAKAMEPAAEHLSKLEWQEAVPVAQQALQQLLRAESAYRDVQVSMQRSNSGGGGSQTARNFAEMFELEMDVEKNKYETQSQLSLENKQQEIDEALAKLKELAERQEKLAQQKNQSAQQMQEQRWKQEQLRREAEDLRRQLAELARNEPQQGSPAASDQHGGSQASNALDSLQSALNDMRAANSDQQQQSGNAQQSARDAAERLRQAQKQMERKPGQSFADKVEALADRAQDLADDQRGVQDDLNNALSEARQRRGGIDPGRAAEIAQTKQTMGDELSQLQSDLRNMIQQGRKGAPEVSNRLKEAADELDSANVATRISRGAQFIQYGRAREVAPLEGVIGEALEELERNLRATAVLAANTEQRDGTQAEPRELLAQIAEMRRALQERQRAAANAPTDRERRQPGAGGNDAEQDERQASDRAQGQGQAQDREGQGQEDAQRREQPGQQQAHNSQSPGQNGNQNSNQPGSQRGGRTPGNSPANGGSSPNGLAAWDPSSRGLSALETGRGQFREGREISERMGDVARRLNSGQMNGEDLRALQRMAHDLRRLAGDPMASQPEAMGKLIDQMELALLAAMEKNRDRKDARTVVQSDDSPQYREAVAEYYRRLGSGK